MAPFSTNASRKGDNSPQLALFGEGSSPEAFVPVPSGRIPVEMRGATGAQSPNVAVHNYAGVDVEPRISHGDVEIIIGKKLAQYDAKLPNRLKEFDRSKA